MLCFSFGTTVSELELILGSFRSCNDVVFALRQNLIGRGAAHFFWLLEHLLRHDEASIGQVDLEDCSFIEGHVAIVSALYWDQVPSLDNIWLREVFEFDVFILKVKVTQLFLSSASATRRAS